MAACSHPHPRPYHLTSPQTDAEVAYGEQGDGQTCYHKEVLDMEACAFPGSWVVDHMVEMLGTYRVA